jgi:hypothetical protein
MTWYIRCVLTDLHIKISLRCNSSADFNRLSLTLQKMRDVLLVQHGNRTHATFLGFLRFMDTKSWPYFCIKPISMKQGPSCEIDNRSSGKQIPCLLCKSKIHYCVHNSPPLDLNQSPLNPVHVHTYYLNEIHFNIILKTTSSSHKSLLSPSGS